MRSIRRLPDRVEVRDSAGRVASFDQVVVASHADQALAILDDPSPDERDLLGAIRYGPNDVILHRDQTLMARRRRAWSSWNYVGHRGERDEAAPPTVSYWMNRLQGLPGPPLFVTLNPARAPRPDSILEHRTFEHPLFDSRAIGAQRKLWSLQGRQRTWFCRAYFGAGFHEDGLQAGLAVAEAIGGVRRPWTVQNESGRLFLPDVARELAA